MLWIKFKGRRYLYVGDSVELGDDGAIEQDHVRDTPGARIVTVYAEEVR